MSTRLTKGRALAGQFAQDGPGYAQGGVPFSIAGTTAVMTSFRFPIGAVVDDVYVKITSVSSTAHVIDIGLATGASSGGVGDALVNALTVNTTGTYVLCASTSHATLAFSYGSYFIASSSAAVTVLKKPIIGSTDTYQYLNITDATSGAIVGTIYPIFTELS